jgi:hypothetical protein
VKAFDIKNNKPSTIFGNVLDFGLKINSNPNQMKLFADFDFDFSMS